MNSRTPSDEQADDLAEFERELASLSPRPASRELRRRIADEIDRPLIPVHWYAPLATAAAIALASLLTLLLPSGGPAPDDVQPMPPVAAGRIDLSQPTLIAYRHAAADSEAALDQLLDDHARRNRDHALAAPAHSAFAVRGVPSL